MLKPCNLGVDFLAKEGKFEVEKVSFLGFLWFSEGLLLTLPETNSSPLKIGIPNRKVVFQPSMFTGYVSFREGIFVSNKPGMM